MKCDELTPIELECNMGKDINGVEHRVPWKAYDIDEVNAAIAELKDEINRKDGVCKRWFERCMEARTENIRLKRALWLARAEIARTSAWVFWNRKDDYNYNKWKKVEFKCRVKAEANK